MKLAVWGLIAGGLLAYGLTVAFFWLMYVSEQPDVPFLPILYGGPLFALFLGAVFGLLVGDLLDKRRRGR